MERARTLLAALLVAAAVEMALVPLGHTVRPAAVAETAAGPTNIRYSSNFTVSPAGYVTVYLYGVPRGSTVYMYWGLEHSPQGAWYYAVPRIVNGTTYYVMSTEQGSNRTAMAYEASANAFVATVGPFLNGTLMAYVFNVNGSTWLNYDNRSFWNWNVLVNPPMNVVGYTRAWVLPNGSIVITTIGRAGDPVTLHYGLTNGSQTGLPWYNISNEVMQYNPLGANYTAMIGPFRPGQWVQWVYHDNTTGWWIHNSNVSANANFAIQDNYPFARLAYAEPNLYVYTEGQEATITLALNVSLPLSATLTILANGTQVAQRSVSLSPGTNYVNVSFPVRMPQGAYSLELVATSGGSSISYPLPQVYVLNTTGKRPISVVIVWHMHQPLYLEPNGSWGQPWAIYHVGQDTVFEGQLMGAYFIQAYLLNKFTNVNVTMDFTPVLLYQWEAFLNQSSPVFLTGGVNVSYDRQMLLETLALYRKLISEGRLEVLTAPFYHPLMALEYDYGWGSDLLAQLLMGKNMTYYVFGVRANGSWTPEMAFNDNVVGLYSAAGINVTVLDYEAFVQDATNLTVISGNLSQGPFGVYLVQGPGGQRMYVLFRDTNLSDVFSYTYFRQSPQLTAQDFIEQLAQIYMQHPGGVVVIAFDGENPIIFNPMPQSAYDLEAIYSDLSVYQQEGWLVTQTVSQAIATHPVAAVLANLPQNTWALSFYTWNNSYPAKQAIWRNVSLAREYMVALSNLLGLPLSPVVKLSAVHAPNASISWFEATMHMPYAVNTSSGLVYNPYYMYYTLWNYLYVSEGSDWAYQTGPPYYGPEWFSAQPIIYDSAIDSYVTNQVFKEVYPASASISDNGTLVVGIYNGLRWNQVAGDSYGVPLHVVVVLSNGTANVSAEVTLNPGINYVAAPGLSVAGTPSIVYVYLYAPLSPSQTGWAVEQVGRYGLLMGSYALPLPFTLTTTTTVTTTTTTTLTTTATVTATVTNTTTTTVTQTVPVTTTSTATVTTTVTNTVTTTTTTTVTVTQTVPVTTTTTSTATTTSTVTATVTSTVTTTTTVTNTTTTTATVTQTVPVTTTTTVTNATTTTVTTTVPVTSTSTVTTTVTNTTTTTVTQTVTATATSTVTTTVTSTATSTATQTITTTVTSTSTTTVTQTVPVTSTTTSTATTTVTQTVSSTATATTTVTNTTTTTVTQTVPVTTTSTVTETVTSTINATQTMSVTTTSTVVSTVLNSTTTTVTKTSIATSTTTETVTQTVPATVTSAQTVTVTAASPTTITVTATVTSTELATVTYMGHASVSPKSAIVAMGAVVAAAAVISFLAFLRRRP